MNRFYKASSYLLLVCNLLLIFLLFFEERVKVPLWVSPFGRLHPMLLHLPIGFSIILVLIILIKKEIEPKSYTFFVRLMLIITALTSCIAALMGFFLSREGGYDAGLLQWHKWTGVGVSVFTYALTWFYEYLSEKTKLLQYLSVFCLVLFILAGHYGAAITHGENYVLEAFENKKKSSDFSNESNLYAVSIVPILEKKCMACHNDQKVKGELNMSSVEKILKGGKHGALWKAGDTLHSLLLQRVHLPLEEKEHMPPKGKEQLTFEEIALLSAWIQEGANIKKTVKDYPEASKTRAMALKIAGSGNSIITYDFAEASESTLTDVNTPFCVVSPLAAGSPALEAEFFVSRKFDKKSLENLAKVKEQLVELSLSKMPVKDEDIKLIAQFRNLEKLNLNQTDISGSTLDQLAQNKKLYSVTLSGTKIGKAQLQKLMVLPALKEVFVWNTSLDSVAIQEFAKKYPGVVFDTGYRGNPKEVLKLNPPILVNEDFILKKGIPVELKHTLKNVQIHYTLDGTDPDSTTGTIYTKPLVVDSYTRLKALATKDGWLASNRVSYTFFKAGFVADTALLLTLPKPQYAGKGARNLIDLKKGPNDNHGDAAWLGYQQEDFVSLLKFKKSTFLSMITLSYLMKPGSHIMPPATVEVWGGSSEADLKKLQKIVPEQPDKMQNAVNMGINVPIRPGDYKVIKVVVKPLPKLPKWHPEKGKPGWFCVDEIFLN
ncbi:FN3 associated domain-containing protein [Emticicia sp. 21SJ11W-3]|uniref:FN3 associated domain-containing protein n=1 Tax=Emticicia sp. 21SJ11W-3 TaxID=2916755 RepID=UPI00209E5009|nr:FN3 associated domain-containing protein [Emticicia sp. 21SJ11W-3]UTA67446.1 chitobiase/beta-hexosaminidase C-terminal domain-containing protein [Emticicia sp. 21SJ11W-3]